MNKIKIAFVLVAIAMSSCKESVDSTITIISGTVQGTIKDSLQLYDKDYKPIKTLYLVANKFADTLEIDEGYYFVGDWNTLLFLKPTYNLNMELIYTEDVSKSLFSGNGANENTYLEQKREYDKTFENVENYKYYTNLDEEVFIKLADSINLEKNTFLSSYKNIDDQFKALESFSNRYQRIRLLNNYKQGHGQMIENPEFRVSSSYPDAYENIELSNEAFLIHPNYLGINYMYAISKIDKTNDEDDLLVELEAVDKFIKSQKIKEQLFYERTELLTQTGKLSDNAYQLYTKVVKNPTYLDEINEIYQERKHIAQGEISPSFEFYDINNNLIALESLRGKLVYIDVWATWCIPCIQEIPALKTVQNEFKNKDIYFVSICLKDTKENLEKMIAEKELEGIQLLSPNENNEFFEKFLINKIPRFILIDKGGKIIDAYAYKPSDEKLKELLLKNL